MSNSFNIDLAFNLVRDAVASYAKAALFELYARGWTSSFQILVDKNR